jgi:hypothetical protein
LKPVEVPNLLKNTKIYETTSNLIITNSKKDAKLIPNKISFSNLNENENNKKIIIFNGKNKSPILIDNNNSNTINNNKIFLNSKNSLNSPNAKNKLDKKESLINAQSESNSALFNSSDYNSSKSSWRFDKNLLDDSSFRKANIKKEKMEIDCDKELTAAGHKKTLSTQTFDNAKIDLNDNQIRESLINNKFLAFSSANRKNATTEDYNLNCKENAHKFINANNKEIINEKDIEGNSLLCCSNVISEYSGVNEVKEVNVNINNIEKFPQHEQNQQQVIEDLRKNLSNNPISNSNSAITKKIISNLDKNGFVNKNIVNMKNLEINKNILQNNNATISQNSQSNISNYTNNNPNIQNNSNKKNINNNNINSINQVISSKKPENKLNKSLSSFKFEFDEEDNLNASTYSNFKKPENEEVFNKIMNYHILMEFHEVHDFLESLSLEKYLDNFLKNGFEDLEKIIIGIQFIISLFFIFIILNKSFKNRKLSFNL